MLFRKVSKKSFILLAVAVSLWLSAGPAAAFTEPNITTYTSYPLFLNTSITPNILVILDNSGSMNFNAYGAYPGDYSYVSDSYLGVPYQNFEKRVAASKDDSEERGDGYNWYDSDDLDLGRDISAGYENTTIGLRFTGVKIPKGAHIARAYVEFRTRAVYGGAQSDLELSIKAETSDNASQFESSYRNISNRGTTTASVDWTVGPWNTTGELHQTPDLKNVIQEIIDRPGWNEGNALAIILTNKSAGPASGRMASSYEHSASYAPLLHIELASEDATRYYGYFNPDYFYYWNSSRFDHKYKKVEYVGTPGAGGYWRCQDLNGNTVNIGNTEIVGQGLWDGNWMNWATMRRVDVLRKVLFGGLATSRTGGGNQVNYAETPAQSSRVFRRHFDTTNDQAVTPYHGNYYYSMEAGYIKIGTSSSSFPTRYTLAVQKNVDYEPEDFANYDSGDNLAGVLQRVGNKARWGNEVFQNGTGTRGSGGRVTDTIGTNMVSLITNLQNMGCDTNTPLAESYYVATQYFRQEDPQSGLDYANGVAPHANLGDDPYYNDGKYVECAKSFVILLTDGASTRDGKIPSFLKDYDGDGVDGIYCDESSGSGCDYASGGTDFLDDVALYARTNDLRPDLGGVQNLYLYAIYAFGDEPEAQKLLKDAARNGGFTDKNGNNRPDGTYTDAPADRVEWDENGDGNPDTYYEASDGYKLEKELLKAITDILKRASSGTAVSVLATSSEGEGTLVQAYFKPSVTENLNEVKWVGYLQSLWVDSLGRTREDTSPQGDEPGLVLSHDKIVDFFYDEIAGEARFYRFEVDANGDKAFTDSNGNGLKDAAESYIYTVHKMEELEPIWEAGKLLSQRTESSRTLYTFADLDNDGVVDAGEYLPFTTANSASIAPFLGVKDSAAWTYLDGSAAATPQTRAQNLIKYIRGADTGLAGTPDVRPRTLDGKAWKLGDIVESTPTTVGKPLDNYGLIYGDQTYQDYYNTYKDRDQVVYVGANDGVLHAIFMGRYNTGDNVDTPAAAEEVYFDKPAAQTLKFGDELWGYVPKALLPHLKWLPDPDYTHVYYVDLKPKIVDARIFTAGVDANGVNHPNGWGTILVGGLNTGGKSIQVRDDFPEGTDSIRTFTSSIFAIDVTDPAKPQLLWEKSYPNMGLTTSHPAVSKVGNNWFVIVGSGVTDYDGSSTQNGHIFIADLATGALLRDYQAGEDKAFFGSPVTVDYGLNYNADVGFIGEAYSTNQGWKGKMYRFKVPKTSGDWRVSAGTDVYNVDPLQWTFTPVFSSAAPITAAPSASIDSSLNLWVYFGTGRYFSESDKISTDLQYFYGFKDPYYNSSMYTTQATAQSAALDSGDLQDSTGINVYTDGSVDGLATVDYWSELIAHMQTKDGWYVRLLNSSGQAAGERVLNKPTVLGGIVFDTTFTPNPDPCGFSGNSSLLGLFYQTGTAYTEEVFSGGSTAVAGQSKRKVDKKTELGLGRGSSVSIHVGQQEGATGYVQQSTGIVESLELNPAFNLRSGFIYWREK